MRRLASFLWKWVDIAMAALLGAMIVLVFANVVMRYGFSSGLRVSVELSRLGFVWVVMLGAAVVLRRGEHLAVTEFSEAFFPRAVPLLRRLAWLVVLVSVSMLFWGALRQTIANWHNISPLTGLPTGLVYLSGVVSGLLMAVVAIVRLFGNPSYVQPQVENHQ
ncbi:TRAP transporter small permease [Phyllobacterium salinisoli]|uniref:TRAP transporter small permease protein n=1 Tax=Phyllobacterium salinisoli TaxID=1899321 RepID=A0A368K2E3_9HYPH|nr:TRAP transporter small permease [Phyllobacterium salinisoli]RCS22805.1 TRAP transporter small permease [Phyllobacterium salinisoli]